MHLTAEQSQNGSIGSPREVNSNVKIKQMLANLDNAEHQTQDAILEN